MLDYLFCSNFSSFSFEIFMHFRSYPYFYSFYFFPLIFVLFILFFSILGEVFKFSLQDWSYCWQWRFMLLNCIFCFSKNLLHWTYLSFCLIILLTHHNDFFLLGLSINVALGTINFHKYFSFPRLPDGVTSPILVFCFCFSFWVLALEVNVRYPDHSDCVCTIMHVTYLAQMHSQSHEDVGPS